MTTDQSAHAQKIPVSSSEEEFYPAHPPREDTPLYEQTHKFMIGVHDMPCEICGVKKSTLHDKKLNPFDAKDMETHHRIQREFADALDWQKVSRDYPGITSREDFLRWVDSPANMRILCDVHHRSSHAGIHHLLTDDFIVEKYAFDGYVVDDSSSSAMEDIAKDNAIVNEEVPTNERI